MFLLRLLSLASLLLPRIASADASPAEARLLALANQERSLCGHAALAWDETLAVVARRHAEGMREMGRLSHESADGSRLVDRVARAGLRMERVAENVANAGDVDAAHRLLMASKGHRDNILDGRLTVAGFGVIEARDGTWIVQDFGLEAPAWSETEAEAAILDALRARGWAHFLDPAMSDALEPVAAHLAAADTASVRGQPNPGCWILGYTAPNPAELPEGRRPSCTATRAGIAATWARTPTRPLGTWFVALSVAP